MAPLDDSFRTNIYDDNNEHSYAFEPAKESLGMNAAPILTFSLKKAKSVAFNEKVAAKKTIHINDYTDEEVHACWYTHQENEIIKSESLLESSALLESEAADDDDYGKNCFRGLEHYIKPIAEQRLAHKDAALCAVLEEQELQREEGSFDPEYIAEIYENIASLSGVKSRITGLNDRLEAIQ